MPQINGASRKSGVVVTQRMQAAGSRACEAYRRTRELAEAVSEELGETTTPGTVPQTELHDEDSLVIVVKDAIAANAKL